MELDPELLDEDASLRRGLAELDEPALRDLLRILEAPQPYRDAVQRALVARPAAAAWRSSSPWPTPTRSCG